MNTENFKKWIAALRSGMANQAFGVLHRAPRPNEDKPTMCCLGVGSHVAGIPSREFSALTVWPVDRMRTDADDIVIGYQGAHVPGSTEVDGYSFDMQPYELNAWLGLKPGTLCLGSNITDRVTGPTRYRLHYLNDAGFSFEQIADLMEYFGVASIETEW